MCHSIFCCVSALVAWLIILSSSCYAQTLEEKLLSVDVKSYLTLRLLNNNNVHIVWQNPDQARAWMFDMQNRLAHFIKDQDLRHNYLQIIQYEALRAEIDPQIILAIITVESRFNQFAISRLNARGLMQIMPFWQQLIGVSSQDLFDVQTNIRYGCTILRFYLYKEHGNLAKALARYNGSIGQTWYPELVFKIYEEYWHPYPLVSIKGKSLQLISPPRA